MQNNQRVIERKDAADAEAQREEQRKANNIVWEQWRRNEVKQIEKLEDWREEKRAANQLKNQQMMITMMENMFKSPNTHQQQMPATAILPSPPATPIYSEQLANTSTSASYNKSAADDLAASMNRTNLDPANLVKKQKTSNPLNLDENHPSLPPPTEGP